MVFGFGGVFTDLLIQEHSFGYKVFTLIDSGFKISGHAAKPPESLYNLGFTQKESGAIMFQIRHESPLV